MLQETTHELFIIYTCSAQVGKVDANLLTLKLVCNRWVMCCDAALLLKQLIGAGEFAPRFRHLLGSA